MAGKASYKGEASSRIYWDTWSKSHRAEAKVIRKGARSTGKEALRKEVAACH